MPEDWLHASMGERHRLGSRRRTPHGPRTGEEGEKWKLGFRLDRKYVTSNRRRIHPRNQGTGVRQVEAVACGPVGPLSLDLWRTRQTL